MGYYPGDMMSEYLSENTVTYYLGEKAWSWEEETDGDEWLADRKEEGEIKFEPDAKAEEIEDAKPTGSYITVFYSGEWFESTEEAYLYGFEEEILKRMLKTAWEAGVNAAHYECEFESFVLKYTHGGAL